MPNFVKIGQSVAEILHFLFFKLATAVILNLENRKIYWLTGTTGQRRIAMLNSSKIAQSVADILRSFDF